jgi:hypothetical protein
MIQSLNLDPHPRKQRNGKGKKEATQKKSIIVNEFSIKEKVERLPLRRKTKEDKILGKIQRKEK